MDKRVSNHFWVNPNYLPPEVVRELTVAVSNSGLPDEQRPQMLAFANNLAQHPTLVGLPIAKEREELEKVASSARRLLANIRSMHESTEGTLFVHMRESRAIRLSELSYAAVEATDGTRPEDFLDRVVESVTALGEFADYAGSQLQPTRQDKPTQEIQRALVSNLAAHHLKLSGSLPPSNEASWFADFVRVLGAFMGLHDDAAADKQKDGSNFIGPRIIQSGIKAVKR